MRPGDTLGPYRVEGKLGEGGMGAVFRARDPRLDRPVAVKLLLDEAAGDPSRRERFLLEARAIAALAHPNIVTIYSVEEDAGRVFLTMEYVEGRTIAALIPAGGMALDRLLALAIPLADAIAAAHQKSIVHRDLKPSNVMVSHDGRVKVLDFGLAKLLDPSTVDGAVTMAAPAPITADGVVLGTIAYMAPEQAEGRLVDHRADIFALGVILYEMATGRRPFIGESSAALIASILRDMPPPVTEVNAAMPGEFARIVRRCLAKDPTRRYQTALDVRNELEELQRDLPSGQSSGSHVPSSGAGVHSANGAPPSSPSAAPASAPPPAQAPASSPGAAPRRSWLLPAGIGAVAVVVLLLGLKLPRPVSAPQPGAVPQLVERQVTSNPAEDPVWYVGISPDGKYMAYGDHEGVHLRLVDTGETRTIPAPEGICYT
jgi:serine/threonine protein kinase